MDRTPHWRQCIKIPVGDLFSVKRRNRELYLLQWICLSHASADPFVLALYLCCCFVFFSFDAADCIRTNSHPTLAEGKNKNVYLNNPKRNFSGRGGGASLFTPERYFVRIDSHVRVFISERAFRCSSFYSFICLLRPFFFSFLLILYTQQTPTDGRGVGGGGDVIHDDLLVLERLSPFLFFAINGQPHKSQ